MLYTHSNLMENTCHEKESAIVRDCIVTSHPPCFAYIHHASFCEHLGLQIQKLRAQESPLCAHVHVQIPKKKK